jgi:hypothetical protein
VKKTEPWVFDCDFGRDPLPHELVALARDESGEVVTTARQLVNLPRSRSEVRLVLLGPPGAPPTAARLIIGSPLFVEPVIIEVELDGKALNTDDSGNIPLPQTDPSDHHLLTASVEFSDGSSAHTALSFTGGYSGVTSTELTAVPITMDERRSPTVEGLQSTFRVRGRPVPVSTIEQPGGRVLMVRDHSATEHLKSFGEFRRRQMSRTRYLEIRNDARFNGTRGSEESLFRTVVPIPIQVERVDDKLEQSFWASPLYRMEKVGLAWCVTQGFARPRNLAGNSKNQQITEALAIAGLQAAGSGRPRVVVLVVGDKESDASRFRVEGTRRFLDSLNVPLVIWTTDSTAAARWEGGVPIEKPKQLRRASQQITELVESQWIVWLEGLHLPGNITTASQNSGIRIATR